MSFQYNDNEKLKRKKAKEALADPNISDWHRRRYEGDLRRTEAEARKRVERKDTQRPPIDTRPGAWSAERIEAFREKMRKGVRDAGSVAKPDPNVQAFIGKVRSASSGGVQQQIKPKPAAANPTTPSVDVSAPRVTLTDPDVEKYCEFCQAPFDICHCDKPQPTTAALIEQASADDKENAECRDDLTICPLCLCERRYCQHRGSAQGAAQ